MKFRLDESNELEQRAKKHKKTDVKGAIGWFQNPGDPKTMEVFNNSFGNSSSNSSEEAMIEDYNSIDIARATIEKRYPGYFERHPNISDRQIISIAQRLTENPPKQKEQPQRKEKSLKDTSGNFDYESSGKEVFKNANGDIFDKNGVEYPTDDEILEEDTNTTNNIFDIAQKAFGKDFVEKHSIGYILDTVDALQESTLDESKNLSAQDKQELKKVIEVTDDPETIAAFLKIKKDGITEDLNREFRSYLSSNPKKINKAMKLFNVTTKEELSEKLDSLNEDEIDSIFEKVSNSRLRAHRANKCMNAIEEAIKMTNSDDYDEIAEIANAITDDEFGIIGDTVREYYDSLNSKIETSTPKLYKTLEDYDNDYIAWDAEVGKQQREDMYRNYIGVDDDYKITEDNLSKDALNYVGCHTNVSIDRIKEELLSESHNGRK